MGADVLTTWGVVLDLDGIVDGERRTSAGDWFAEGRAAFFDQCPRLAAFLRTEDAELRPTAEHVGRVDPASCAGGVTIGVSVVEVRPSSFTMAVRIRPAGSAGRPTDGRCTVLVQRRATGERLPIPHEVRDEFIAIQLAARDLC
jgi:acyl-CoA thioesterase FadM